MKLLIFKAYADDAQYNMRVHKIGRICSNKIKQKLNNVIFQLYIMIMICF